MHLLIKTPATGAGFTLIELIIYMGLITTLLVITSQIFFAVLDVQTESEANSAIEQDGRFILARLSYDFNESTLITTPLNLGDTSVTLSLDNGTKIYENTNGNLLLNGSQLNSTGTTISNLLFTRLGNSGVGKKNTVRISFRLTSTVLRTKGPDIKDFQTTIGTR